MEEGHLNLPKTIHKVDYYKHSRFREAAKDRFIEEEYLRKFDNVLWYGSNEIILTDPRTKINKFKLEGIRLALRDMQEEAVREKQKNLLRIADNRVKNTKWYNKFLDRII